MRIFEENADIRGTYTVERFLGEGAFAEVYRVRHRFLGRQAMKVFKRPVDSADEVVSLLSEAILLSRIGHPNIVRVFDANVVETPKGLRGFFTMENVAGGTLDTFLRSQTEPLSIEVAVDLARQICRGLAVAHVEVPPIIHRDIKPQNILVGYETTGLRARIGDFGLARQVDPLTLLASAAGTLAFKPPEVFDDFHADSPAGDIYAVGVTLYLMLTESLPYALPEDLADISAADFGKSPRRPEELNLDADSELGDIVMRCLCRDPSDRYPDARALLADLEAWHPHQARSEPGENGLAQDMAKEALRLAREEARLADASDKMEEAFSLSPLLREKYASRVRLWRAGVSM